MPQPSINQRLEISASEMEALWQHGSPTKDALATLPGEGYIRSKRSENGDWFLKLHQIEGEPRDKTAEEICGLHDIEVVRFQAIGWNVISFARVPLNERHAVLSVAPWIENENPLPESQEEYTRMEQIATGWLRQYYEERHQAYEAGTMTEDEGDEGFFATDLGTDDFALVEAFGPEPFLMDTDPQVDSDPDLLADLRMKWTLREPGFRSGN